MVEKNRRNVRWTAVMVVVIAGATVGGSAYATGAAPPQRVTATASSPSASAGATAEVSERGAACTAPADPDCGVCAVSCRLGEAAVCIPGKRRLASPRGETVCARPPACRCETVAPPAAQDGDAEG